MALKSPADSGDADSLASASVPGRPARARGGEPYTVHFQALQQRCHLRQMFGDERFGIVANGIADGAEAVENLVLRASGLRRIGKAVMDEFSVGGEIRAPLARAVADREHEIEVLPPVRVDVVRRVAGDVDAGFAHDGDGARIHAMRLDARAEDLGAVPGEMPQPALGHLTAATVSGTEYEDAHQGQRAGFRETLAATAVAAAVFAAVAAIAFAAGAASGR